MHTRKSRIAVIAALSAALAAVVAPSAAAAPRTDAGGSLPAGAQTCTAAATKVVPRSAHNAHIACTDDVLTATVPSHGTTRTLVYGLHTGRTADVTGLGPAAEQSGAADVARTDAGDGTVRPMYGNWYIDDPYHAHTDENLFYAIVTNGEVEFISWVKMTSRIGLQFRHHYFNLSWTQLENRSVTVDVDVRSREDITLWPDRTVEEDLYGNASYQTSWSQDGYLTTDGPGVFYWDLHDRSIRDAEYGSFKVIDDFESPHYRCYKTVPCKYPDGQEA
jgi:hypothetical protein